MRKQATLGDYITRMFNKDLETRDRLKLAEAVDNLPPGEAEALAQELAGGEKKDPPKKCEGEECKDDEKKEASFEFDPNTPEFLQKVAEADGLGRWIAHAQIEGLVKQADFFGKSVEERAVGMAAQRQGAPEQQKEAFTPGIASDLGMLGIPSLVGYGVGSSAGRAEAASGEARPRWGLGSALALGFVPGATGYQLGHRVGYNKVKGEMARRAASQTQTPAASPPTVAAQPGPEEPAKVGSAIPLEVYYRMLGKE